MARSLLLLCAVACAFGADDPWAKVKGLKSGTEVRIVRRGSAKPVEAKLDEARDDAVVIVLKNEQVSISKDEIERLDYRPKPGSRVTTKSEAKDTDPDPTPPAGMGHGAAVPGKSYSTNVGIGSKPDYETLYRRAVGKPAAPRQ